MIKFELSILGTSSALPTSTRYPTAQVLNVRERFFLIDCGEGTQIQLQKLHIRTSRINHILISHLHGDHYFGLIGLLSTLVLLNRKHDLHIFAHSVLPEILKAQIDFMGDELPFKIIWHPLNFKRKQVIFEDEAVSVTSFPLKHRVSCCGFLFQEKERELNIRKQKIEQYNIPIREIHKIKQGADFELEDGNLIPNSELTFHAVLPRSYAFCTDTIFLPKLKKIIEDVDLLYHEATYDSSMEKQAIKTGHTTAKQAAKLAKLSNAKKLIIGHFSARYKSVEALLNEAREIFPATFAAKDGDVINIKEIKQDRK